MNQGHKWAEVTVYMSYCIVFHKPLDKKVIPHPLFLMVKDSLVRG